jgi:hypothetical protein
MRPHETLRLRLAGLEHASGAAPDPASDGWLVFSAVRNEELRLPYFLRFYREMGTAGFAIADNDSTDRTTALLAGEPDVALFRAGGRYSRSRCGVDWINALLHRFGRNRWCLVVDADELLVFPYCEDVGLRELLRHLDASGAQALPTFLLDMYSRGPIRDARYRPGQPFLSASPYFDPQGYVEFQAVAPGRALPARGGPRHRLFWQGRTRVRPSPLLVKYPLVRWDAGLRYEASTHALPSVTAADVTGALLHFKLFDDFPARVHEEVNRREHFDDASQYASYWDVLFGQPDLSAHHAASAEYRGSRQLLELGLIHSVPSFDSLVGGRRS